MPSPHRLTVSLDAATLTALEERARSEGRSASACARRLLERDLRIMDSVEQQAPVLEKLAASGGMLQPHDVAQVETRARPSKAGSVALTKRRDTSTTLPRSHKARQKECHHEGEDCRLHCTGRFRHLYQARFGMPDTP